MKFWKMNGAGNDFIVIDNRDGTVDAAQWPRIARTLCERHLSLGADGLMVVERPANGGDYRMLFLNSDGSIGEMCGNGARCICRYGYENGLAGDVQRVETTAGLVTGWRVCDVSGQGLPGFLCRRHARGLRGGCGADRRHGVGLRLRGVGGSRHSPCGGAGEEPAGL